MYKHVLALLTLTMLTACVTQSRDTIAAGLSPTPLLDHVYFGDAASEERHRVRSDRTPLINGGLEQAARAVQLEGSLSFTLKCDPEQTNLVTLRLWGGDVKQIIEARDGTALRMEAEKIKVFAGDKEIPEETSESLSDTPLLPGRFIYRTVAVPEDLTRGKQEITLTVKPAGQVGGGYAAVGGPPPEKTSEGSFSRGIYAAYSHTANLFIPSDDEKQGDVPDDTTGTIAIPVPEGNRPDFEGMRENLIRAMDEGVSELLNRQLYGAEFEAARRELGIPAKLRGLFDWTGLDTFIQRGRDRDWEPDDPQWLMPVTGSASGRGHAGAGHVFMNAYRCEGSQYYGDQAMIDRSIAVLDGYCRYQGAKGGFEIGGGQWGWVGGPDRKRATGGLPGYLAGGLAQSFLAVYPELKENPGLLQEKIDNNGDGEKTITRREAYTQLFRDWLHQDYVRLALRTACANQDAATAHAAFRVNECLEILSPPDSFPKEIIRAALRQSLGIMPREPQLIEFVEDLAERQDINISRRGGDQYMLSPGGITMEWGFCPGYGQMQGKFSEICREVRDSDLDRQYETFLDAIQHFFIPWHGPEGFKWVVEGVVGSRAKPVFFNDGRWLPMLYPAAELGNPIAKRVLRQGLAHTGNFSDRSHGPQDRMHLTGGIAGTIGILKQLPEYRSFWESPVTEYRLPSERPAPYAWTDPTSSARILDPVMIKVSDREILYLQGRRCHFITDQYHSYGGTHVKEDDHLAQGVFGPYHVVVNRSDTPDINETGGPRIFVPPENLNSAVNLLDGKSIDLSQPVTVPPAAAFILDTRDNPDAATGDVDAP